MTVMDERPPADAAAYGDDTPGDDYEPEPGGPPDTSAAAASTGPSNGPAADPAAADPDPSEVARPGPDVAAAVRSGLGAMVGPTELPDVRVGDTWNIGGDGSVHYAVKGRGWLCGTGRDGVELGDAWPTTTPPAGACATCLDRRRQRAS